MARIRSVKPELRTSNLVASWPFELRYFFVLLWGYLDDKGRGLDVPKQIAGDCFPHDDKVTASKVDKWLDRMAHGLHADTPGPVCRYEVNGRRYLHCLSWGEHQKVNRPTPSRLPPCPVHDTAEGSNENENENLPNGNEVTNGSRDQKETTNQHETGVSKSSRDQKETDASGSNRSKQEFSPGATSHVDGAPLTEPFSDSPPGDSLNGRAPVFRSRGAGVVGAGEQQTRGVSESPPRAATTPPHAARLVAKHVGPEFPSAVRAALAWKAAELLRQYDEPTVGEALDTWRQRPDIGPGLLPSLVADVVKRRDGHVTAVGVKPSTADARMAAIQALKHPEPPEQAALPAGATP